MGKETVLFQTEEKMELRSVSVFLRQLADKLDQQKVVLTKDKQTVTLKIPSNVELEIKVEKEKGKRKSKKKLEIEIEWVAGGVRKKASGPVTLG